MYCMGAADADWMGRLGVNHLLCSSSNIISLDNCPSPPPNLRFLFKYWARSHHISDIQDIWSICISPDSLDSSVGDANQKQCNTQFKWRNIEMQGCFNIGEKLQWILSLFPHLVHWLSCYEYSRVPQFWHQYFWKACQQVVSTRTPDPLSFIVS